MLYSDDFLELVRFFWIIILPNFAMIFAVRCVDVFAFRRLRAIKGAFAGVMIDLLTVSVFQLALATVEALLSELDLGITISAILLVPTFSVLALYVAYCIDRRRSSPSAEVQDIVKGAYKSNIVIALSYDILYGVFFCRYFLMEISWEKSESVKSDGILIAAVIVLLVIGAAWKIIDSVRRVGDIERGAEKK